MSLKESLIQQTEQAVDGLRKRRTTLETELEGVLAEEKEARDMLMFLKNGKPPMSIRTSSMNNIDSVLEIVYELPERFDTARFRKALNVNTNTQARNWLKKLIDADVIEQVGKEGNLLIYRKI